MSDHEHDLIAFLAGDLGPEQAREFDRHLLSCESCWSALRADRTARGALERLRDPPPPGLADRIRLAIDLHAHTPVGSPRPRRRWLAGTAIAAAAITSLILTLVMAHPTPTVSPAVTAIVEFAKLSPPPGGHTRTDQQPTRLGLPITLTAGGQRLYVSYYQIGDDEVVAAASPSQFAMPQGGRPVGQSDGMAWSATRSGITLFCLNGPRPTLLAAAIPLAALQALSGRLRLPG